MTGMPWGGSEELWYRAARQLRAGGHQLAVNYKWWPKLSFQLGKLQEEGARLCLREQPPGFWQRKSHELRQLVNRKSLPTRPRNADGRDWLLAERPDAVLITIGYHPDPIYVARHCQDLGIPYAINVQCASTAFFIHGDRIDDYRSWYLGAQRVYFVSAENQRKVERNLAVLLPNAEIVANPFHARAEPAPWPATDEGLRLACVGRIHFQSKGQDVLVDVMHQDKWRQRPLSIHFYGHDQGNRRQLDELIQLFGLESQLHCHGFVGDVQQIWSQNHGLVLPSRYEGAPLVVVEAMHCHRMVVATDIGRNRELIDEGESGFIAPVATLEMLDDALERAWAARGDWQRMGERAGEHIRQRFSANPVAEFAAKLLQIPQE